MGSVVEAAEDEGLVDGDGTDAFDGVEAFDDPSQGQLALAPGERVADAVVHAPAEGQVRSTPHTEPVESHVVGSLPHRLVTVG